MIFTTINLSIFYVLITLSVIFFSKKMSLYDLPSERKIHKSKILNTGGVSIYIFYIYIVSSFELNTFIENIIIFGFFVLVSGFLDDILKLSPGVKLILILFPSSYLIYNGFEIDNLGIYEYINTLYLGKFSFIFSLLCVGLLTNAINYTDGIDGLTLIIVIFSLIYFIFLLNDEDLKFLFYLLLIPLIINLFFNLLSINTGYKLFLGDSGSLFLGFLLSFILIYLSIYEKIHPTILIWSVWYPVYDFLFVTFKRISIKISPFTPRKDHAHHVLYLKFKKNNFLLLIFFSFLNIFFITLGYCLSNYLGKIYALFSFCFIFFIYTYIRDRFNYKK